MLTVKVAGESRGQVKGIRLCGRELSYRVIGKAQFKARFLHRIVLIFSKSPIPNILK